jgi:hypothetical protein
MISLEDRNYINDPRVIAGEHRGFYTVLKTSASAMTIKLEESIVEMLIEDEQRPEDFDGVITVNSKFVVCPLCRGTGKHVNPSIDCNGLTAEDFDEDPDFREEYMNGTYDVTCNECGGKNVVPELEFPPDVQERIDAINQSRAEDRRNAAYGY